MPVDAPARAAAWLIVRRLACRQPTSTSAFIARAGLPNSCLGWRRRSRVTPHEARHWAASYLIAAGLNAKQLSVYIGHSDIRTTYNRYGHLMPGDEAEATAQLDAYLARSQNA